MDSNYKYTVYKTTNIINNKIYIGIHKTKNINDEYLGSGTLLKRSIAKYGIENFKKEILFVFDSSEAMYDKEKEIVNAIFVESENTYNLILGGQGTWEHANSTGKNLYPGIGDETHGKQNLWNGREVKKYLIEKGLWEEWKIKVSAALKEKFSRDGHHWSGRKHTQETKDKQSIKASQRIGKLNSQYGTCWIYSTKQKLNKKIKKEELDLYISQGWMKGRIYKF